MNAHIGSVHSHRRHAGGQRKEATTWRSPVGCLVTLTLALLAVPLASKAQSDDAAVAQDFAALSGDHKGVAQQSIRTLQRFMSAGELTGRELLDIYLRRIQLIDQGLDLNAIIQLNPDARSIANQLDQARKKHGPPAKSRR